MQKTEMYQPTLEQGWKETKSFDIHKLVFVGFFGGAIPLIIMGSMNAIWLKLETKKIIAIAAFGLAVVAAKYLILIYMMMQDSLAPNSSSLKMGYRVSCVLLYGLYYFTLRKEFNSHRYLNKEMVPILGTAIRWSIVGIVIEAIINIIIFNILEEH